MRRTRCATPSPPSLSPGSARLYTVPDTDPAGSIARPYRLREAGDPEPAYEPIVALRPLATERLVAPSTVGRRDSLTALVLLGRRGGNALVEWRETAITASGRAGTPTPYRNTPGLRYRTRLPPGAACVRRVARRGRSTTPGPTASGGRRSQMCGP